MQAIEVLSKVFSPSQLQSLTPDQIKAFSASFVPSPAQASTTQPIHSVTATQLPEDKQLKGASNWIEFKRTFPNMLRELQQWVEPTASDPVGYVGKPLDTVGIYILEKNLKHPSSSNRIAEHACKTAADGWTLLIKEFDKTTVPAKIAALSAILSHSPGLKANIRSSFDLHALNKTALITAFGNTIKTDDLANLLFLHLLQGYPFQTDSFKSSKTWVFDDFQAAVEIEYDSRSKLGKVETPANQVTQIQKTAPMGNGKVPVSKVAKFQCTEHDARFWFEGSCRRCSPCKKCEKAGSEHTWHKQDSPLCGKNPSSFKADTTAVDPQFMSFMAQQFKAFVAKSPSSNLATITMVADSGNTHPIVNNKDVLDLYSSSAFQHVNLAGEGSAMAIAGAGSLSIDTNIGGAVMRDVLHCPDASDNLLSISRLDDHGMGSIFCEGFFVFPKAIIQSFIKTNLNRALFSGYRDGNLYKVDLKLAHSASPMSFMTRLPSRTIEDWHLATNHLHSRAIKQMSKMVDGMVLTTSNLCDCVACIVGKAKQSGHPISNHVVSRIGERICADWIEGLTPGINGETGSLHVLDAASKKSFVFQFKRKSEIAQLLINVCRRIETHLGRPVGTLLLDQGSGFTSTAVRAYCSSRGINLQYSPVDTPQQNAGPERLHYTLMDDVRSMIAQSGLPKSLWPYMMDHASYTRNMCPASGQDRVPNHVWFNRKPNVSHLRPFGYPCYPRIPGKDQKSKLDARATEAIFAGYDDEVQAYRCLDKSSLGLIITSDVQFLKSFQWPLVNHSRFAKDPLQDGDMRAPHQGVTNGPAEESLVASDQGLVEEDFDSLLYETVEQEAATSHSLPLLAHDSSDQSSGSDSGESEYDTASDSSDTHSHSSLGAVIDQEPSHLPLNPDGVLSSSSHGKYSFVPVTEPAKNDILAPPTHSKRVSNPPKSFFSTAKKTGSIFSAATYAQSHHTVTQAMNHVSQLVAEPNHYKDISSRPDSHEWFAACDREIEGLHSRRFIRTLVPRSEIPHKILIYKARYVFTRKASGLAKARWVLRGDMRKRHEKRYPDSEKSAYGTYAPVAENATFKTLCAVVAHEDLEFEMVDVNQAFTCAPHPGNVYVEQPEGYVVPGKEDHVILLDVAVYGLPEAPLLWNEELDRFLTSQGFAQSDADPCLYTKMVNDERMYVLVYVDDLAIAHSSLAYINEFKLKMDGRYGIKDLGSVKRFTSYQVARNRANRTITLHQHDYIAELLQLVKMPLCVPLSAPPTEINHLSTAMCPTTPSEQQDMARIPYRETVGALLHISYRTRPDISHAVSVFARFNSNPGRQHWNAVKNLLRYLKSTSSIGLVLGGRNPLQLTAYVDANFAQDPDSRRSTSGFVFLFGQAAISSKSTLQKAITTSSCEAEIAALFSATSEAIWLRRLLVSMGYAPSGPTILHEDNQGAIKYAKSKEAYGRMKHIEIKNLFIREKLQDASISLEFVPSKDNPADILTKSLTPASFQKHRTAIGLRDC